jgi:hypothetical protein
MEKKHMENMEKKKTAQIMKKENDRQTTTTLDKSSQLAAIYVSQEAKQEVSILKQIEACQKFLNSKGLKFSGDLFLAKDESEFTDDLISSCVRSHRFHYLSSYLLFQGQSKGHFIVLVTCWDARNFLTKSSQINRT